MENLTKKCSSKEHEDINANSYCKECNIYMCKKCYDFHSKLLQTHQSYNLDKIKPNDIFTEFCKEKGHNLKLEFYCKTHNELCCGACLCIIKDKGKGQHKDCDVCIVEKIIQDKKSKISENIKLLEGLSNSFNNSLNQLKKIFETINENKEKLKENIQKVFTKVRNAINQREDELLQEVDKRFENAFFEEKIIKEAEKLPDKINKSLEKGKIIENQLNKGENNLSELMNECINIENNIQNINIIKNKIEKCNNLNELKLGFTLEKESVINGLLEKINNLGEIYSEDDFFCDSLIIKNKTHINNLKDWISKKITKTILLYRKSRDGDSYETFHKLCDNQGANIVLIKNSEFIIGGYTPLDWDNHSQWKNDKDTFLFSLTNNKKYKKLNKSNCSILCGKKFGPFFPYIGFRNEGKKNMSQGDIQYGEWNCHFEFYKEIIPYEGKDRFFDVEEVEVYKINQ